MRLSTPQRIAFEWVRMFVVVRELKGMALTPVVYAPDSRFRNIEMRTMEALERRGLVAIKRETDNGFRRDRYVAIQSPEKRIAKK